MTIDSLIFRFWLVLGAAILTSFLPEYHTLAYLDLLLAIYNLDLLEKRILGKK